jgi:SAM-dependent methyltransferase
MKNSEPEHTWYNTQIENNYTWEQRKNWYSNVADAYNRLRPGYSSKLINRVVELTQLPPHASILEIGCGPGIATVEFAKIGFSILALEPSPKAYQLARNNCLQYPKVKIENTTFEEWELKSKSFNAVLAATSFHWISPEIRSRKASQALIEDGYLILLWNTGVQPQEDIYQILNEVYLTQIPSLAKFHAEERATQSEQLNNFGQSIIDSGYFKNLVSEHFIYEVTYSIDDYLGLLGTYSPYIKLEPQQRNFLFTSLRETLTSNCINEIPGSFMSAFQIAQKI